MFTQSVKNIKWQTIFTTQNNDSQNNLQHIPKHQLKKVT